MRTGDRAEGAKIIAFPRKARVAADGVRRHDDTTSVSRLQRVLPVEFGSAWYHEAAMQDGDRTHK